VLTHNPPTDVPGWMTGTFIDEPIDAAVARAKRAAGGKSVGLLGPGVARQSLEHGLLDEIIITPPLSCSAMAFTCSRWTGASGPASSQRWLSAPAR
jgi:hypothetical protein